MRSVRSGSPSRGSASARPTYSRASRRCRCSSRCPPLKIESFRSKYLLARLTEAEKDGIDAHIVDLEEEIANQVAPYDDDDDWDEIVVEI